jgi:hypothetical protein
MKALIIKEGREPYVQNIDSSLETLQHIVGGRIEELYLDAGTVLICNEEGKLFNLPANRPIKDCNGVTVDYLMGTFLVCGTSWTSDNFKSLTKEQIKRYTKLFSL